MFHINNWPPDVHSRFTKPIFSYDAWNRLHFSMSLDNKFNLITLLHTAPTLNKLWPTRTIVYAKYRTRLSHFHWICLVFLFFYFFTFTRKIDLTINWNCYKDKINTNNANPKLTNIQRRTNKNWPWKHPHIAVQSIFHSHCWDLMNFIARMIISVEYSPVKHCS